jgi:hypothetical protein
MPPKTPKTEEKEPNSNEIKTIDIRSFFSVTPSDYPVLSNISGIREFCDLFAIIASSAAISDATAFAILLARIQQPHVRAFVRRTFPETEAFSYTLTEVLKALLENFIEPDQAQVQST